MESMKEIQRITRCATRLPEHAFMLFSLEEGYTLTECFDFLRAQGFTLEYLKEVAADVVRRVDPDANGLHIPL